MRTFSLVCIWLQDGPTAGFDAEPRVPVASRLFLLYLLFVAVIALVNSVKIARQLWMFSLKRHALSERLADTAHLVAELAMANRMSRSFRPIAERAPSSHFKTEFPSPLLEQAEHRFQYASRLCSGRVDSLKKLLVLTLLASRVVLAFGTTNFLIEVTNQKIVNIVALSAGMAEALVPFVLGMMACTVLYAVSAVYEGALARRRILWDHFVATVNQ